MCIIQQMIIYVGKKIHILSIHDSIILSGQYISYSPLQQPSTEGCFFINIAPWEQAVYIQITALSQIYQVVLFYQYTPSKIKDNDAKHC